jgi:tetratricopeptide (TPR) repeat protein
MSRGETRLGGTALAVTAMLLLACPVSRAAAHQTLNSDPLEQALDHFYNLEYDAAEQELNAHLKDHPDDLRALCYLSRVWMEREMFRRQLLEAQAYGKDGVALRKGKSDVAPELRQKIFSPLDQVERLAQERLKANARDKEALYWLGASHVVRAVYFLSLEKSTMQALSDAKEAQKSHARLLKLDPNYTDAYLVVGTYDYIVGSLPWYTKVVAALIGYSGDRKRGLEELQRAAEQGHWARTDAQTFLSILYFREKDYAGAIRLMESLQREFPRNYLLPQEIARTYKAHNNWRAAAGEYDSIIQKYESRAPGYATLPAAKMYFQAGEVCARLGEQEEALRRYQKAAEVNDGGIYVYRAELAAAAIELSQNRGAEARSRYERVAKAVPDTDEGRAANQALKNIGANNGQNPPRQDAHRAQ